MEPTVGMQDAGLTSIFIKSLTKREISNFSSLIPSIIGYLEATPLFNASISARTPTSEGSNPGTPISILINFSPVFSSISLTTLTSSLMEECPILSTGEALIESLTA